MKKPEYILAKNYLLTIPLYPAAEALIIDLAIEHYKAIKPFFNRRIELPPNPAPSSASEALIMGLYDDDSEQQAELVRNCVWYNVS